LEANEWFFAHNLIISAPKYTKFVLGLTIAKPKKKQKNPIGNA
jgi:hypothetical protein